MEASEVKEIISHIFEENGYELIKNINSTNKDDLSTELNLEDIDSLDLFQIVYEIEEILKIKYDDEIYKVTTLENLVELTINILKEDSHV